MGMLPLMCTRIITLSIGSIYTTSSNARPQQPMVTVVQPSCTEAALSVMWTPRRPP